MTPGAGAARLSVKRSIVSAERLLDYRNAHLALFDCGHTALVFAADLKELRSLALCDACAHPEWFKETK